MRLLDLTLPTAAENLALDEALMDQVADHGDVLRLWESDRPAVIVGRASRIESEVDLAACAQRGVPIMRRCSGGAAVVVGPGCLMYAVVLATQARSALTVVDEAHRFVLSRLRDGLRSLGLAVELSGTSDLTWEGRKFSGNSLRCRRDALLYHGTLLYRAEIGQIATLLTMPPRQPDYRQGRRHQDFLINLPVRAEELRRVLRDVWQCNGELNLWPQETTAQLVRDRYSRAEWNFSR